MRGAWGGGGGVPVSCPPGVGQSAVMRGRAGAVGAEGGVPRYPFGRGSLGGVRWGSPGRWCTPAS